MKMVSKVYTFEKNLREFCRRNSIEMGVDVVENEPFERKYVFLYKGDGFRRKNYDGNYSIVNFKEVTNVYESLRIIMDYLIDTYYLAVDPDPYIYPGQVYITTVNSHNLQTSIYDKFCENPGFTQRFEIDEMRFYDSPEWRKQREQILELSRGSKKEKDMKVKIEKVYFNKPYTIVIWSDKTKTMVKAENEAYDEEKGLAMAICKKFLGTNESKGNYFDEFKKWLPKIEGGPVKEPKMPTYLTPAEFAEKSGQHVSTVRKDCARGLHPGAKKVDGKWMIPYDTAINLPCDTAINSVSVL